VVVVIAIVVSIAVLSTTVLGRDNALTEETQRLNQLIVAAREQAEIQGRDFGLSFYPEGYQFVRFDVRRGVWYAVIADPMFRPRQFPAGVAPRLSIDGREIVLKPLDPDALPDLDENGEEGAPEQEPPPPQIFIFANGDLSPFDLKLEREGTDHQTTLVAEANGTLRMTTADQDPDAPLEAAVDSP
jgi:type II secretion system protein H